MGKASGSLAAEDIEPEMTDSCSQTGLPAEGVGHQPTQKTFDWKHVLLVSRDKDGAETEGNSNDWPNLRPGPW